MRLRAPYAAAFALPALASIGCVTPQPYRLELALCEDSTGEACPTSARHRHPADDVFLGFVELDDQGQLWDPRQLEEVVEGVIDFGTAEGEHGLILLVFVHGWNHDASPGDSNVTRLVRNLALIRQAELQGPAPRAVAGVYLGWRGASVSVPGLDLLTFWDRKSAAHVVGRNGATEVLLRLKHVETSLDPNVPTSLVVVGHSFGGAVVYSALSQVLMAEIVGARTPAVRAPRPFADLVVLVNPAFEALRYAALRDALRRRSQDPTTRSNRPVLTILTSESDGATKYAFPLGRCFSTFWDRERAVDTPDGPFDQEDANRTAIGHFAPYRTHRLQARRPLDLPPPPKSGPLAPALAGEQEQDVRELLQRGDYDYEVLRAATTGDAPPESASLRFTGSELIPEPGTASPLDYMVVLVDDEIMDGHGDIDGPALRLFLQGLIRVSESGGP